MEEDDHAASPVDASPPVEDSVELLPLPLVSLLLPVLPKLLLVDPAPPPVVVAVPALAVDDELADRAPPVDDDDDELFFPLPLPLSPCWSSSSLWLSPTNEFGMHCHAPTPLAASTSHAGRDPLGQLG